MLENYRKAVVYDFSASKLFHFFSIGLDSSFHFMTKSTKRDEVHHVLLNWAGVLVVYNYFFTTLNSNALILKEIIFCI